MDGDTALRAPDRNTFLSKRLNHRGTRTLRQETPKKPFFARYLQVPKRFCQMLLSCFQAEPGNELNGPCG